MFIEDNFFHQEREIYEAPSLCIYLFSCLCGLVLPVSLLLYGSGFYLSGFCMFFVGFALNCNICHHEATFIHKGEVYAGCHH